MSDDAARVEQAGLVYSSDAEPGIGRRRAGRGFVYFAPGGKRITAPKELERIRGLAVPPAWEEVWISPDPDGHLQATGRDARGRKVYRYHPGYRELRDRAKFDRLAAFGDALEHIRQRVADDLARPGLPPEKVLAAVVRLLERTMIRVGNEEYAQANRSYGLTTLRTRHARFDAGSLRFVFRGKSGRQHRVGLDDRRLARVVRRCQELPGQRLFQYLDEDGEQRAVTSSDVNAYLRDAAGIDVTAKDFRTWTGTLLAVSTLVGVKRPSSKRLAAQRLRSVIEVVADKLGNTVTVCRSSYVHPAVVDAWLDGSLPRRWRAGPARDRKAMLAAERKLLKLLRPRGSADGSGAERAAA
jgi:DNA topoisomerase-1